MLRLDSAAGRPRWLQNLPYLALIIVVGSLLYGHTLNVPWYLDDLRAIVENRSLHQLRTALGDLWAPRGIANLTFAINYAAGGANVIGYHLVNIGIHLITSCLVFLLFRRVFRDRLLLAAGGALIFVAHPLQTQAVTYIVQRMTSLAALFFFLALYLYIRAREVPESRSKHFWLYYAGALFSGALAVLIKQNTAVLPVAVLLFDRYFLPAERRLSWTPLLTKVAPFALLPTVLAFTSLVLPTIEGGLSQVGGMPDLVHLRHLSPLNYLVTEFSVIWLYLRLLFIPYGQALDYDLPIVATIWQWKNVIAFLGVAALLTAAAVLRRRLPLVSAGIFWFFLGLAVESTIIPLDPVFEHRLYIPMFGFALVAMDGLARLPRRGSVVGIVLLVTVLGALTWQRNQLWNDPVAFYEDNLRRAPRSERVHLDLANAYRKQGRLLEAQHLYERALQINPDYILIHINLSMVYAETREHQKAVDVLLDGLRRNPSHFKLYNNIGVLYNVLGEYGKAASYLQKGVMLEQYDAAMHFNLALAYDRLGRLDDAIHHYRRSIELDAADPMSHFNLGLALYGKGEKKAALQAFLIASRLNPGHAGTLYNAALTYLDLGDAAAAQNLANRLQAIDREMAANLLSRIRQRL